MFYSIDGTRVSGSDSDAMCGRCNAFTHGVITDAQKLRMIAMSISQSCCETVTFILLSFWIQKPVDVAFNIDLGGQIDQEWKYEG